VRQWTASPKGMPVADAPRPALPPLSRALDVLARLGGAGWFGLMAFVMIRRDVLPLLTADAPVGDGLPGLLRAGVNVAFYGMVVAIFLVRRDPLRKAPGPWPRVAGFLGAFGLLGLNLLPSRTDAALAWTAAALALLAHAWMIAALAWLGRSFSILPEARRLVTTGPYALVRHPLYLAETLAALALVLVHWSAVAALAGVAWFAVQVARMFAEERVLEAAFPEYGDYRRRVRRLLPGVW
jgi:protein-S-isoprenylcysteine O-methyltransferase Ste14